MRAGGGGGGGGAHPRARALPRLVSSIAVCIGAGLTGGWLPVLTVPFSLFQKKRGVRSENENPKTRVKRMTKGEFAYLGKFLL